jgi:hypothetical protein
MPNPNTVKMYAATITRTDKEAEFTREQQPNYLIVEVCCNTEGSQKTKKALYIKLPEYMEKVFNITTDLHFSQYEYKSFAIKTLKALENLMKQLIEILKPENKDIPPSFLKSVIHEDFARHMPNSPLKVIHYSSRKICVLSINEIQSETLAINLAMDLAKIMYHKLKTVMFEHHQDGKLTLYLDNPTLMQAITTDVAPHITTKICSVPCKYQELLSVDFKDPGNKWKSGYQSHFFTNPLTLPGLFAMHLNYELRLHSPSIRKQKEQQEQTDAIIHARPRGARPGQRR